MDRSPVPAIARAMQVLDLLTEVGQSGLTVSDIAGQTGIAKSTTALLCDALEREGLVRRHEGRLRLGRRLLTLGAEYLATVDQLAEFYATVVGLPTISRGAARLALLDGTDVLYLARYEAVRTRRVTGSIGDRFPASITATGKAILATLPDQVVEDRFRDAIFPRYTEKSIQSLPELLDDLARVRDRGYATDLEETNLGQVCYSVAVLDGPNHVAQLSVSTTMTKERASELDTGTIIAELQTLAEVFSNPLEGLSF